MHGAKRPPPSASRGDRLKGAAPAAHVPSWRPTPAQLAAARGKGVRDVIADGLRVLFCGINPGLYTAAIGHHFGRPGNRFWPALHRGGFTPRLLSPFEERALLDWGYGITNLVNYATATAAELTTEQLTSGGQRLAAKVRRCRPRIVAFVGLGAYRTAFDRRHAGIGLQSEQIGLTRLWLLPNPSGLNANHGLAELAQLFGELKRFSDQVRD